MNDATQKSMPAGVNPTQQNLTRTHHPKHYLDSARLAGLVNNWDLVLQNRKEGGTAESSCDEFKDDLVQVMPVCQKIHFIPC